MSDDDFEEQFDISLTKIKCPYCKKTIMDVWESIGDSDDTEIECDECHRIFIISRTISYDITKRREE